MQYYSLSDKGLKDTNEDWHLIKEYGRYYIFAIADGVGSLSEGKYASHFALTNIFSIFEQNSIVDLEQIILRVNTLLINESKNKQQRMATTIIVCIVDIKTKEVEIAHVGDSRAYVINTNIWKTKDHTLVQDLVDIKVITEIEALTHPERHRMSRALGIIENVEVDIHKKLVADSILLLCSDGLSGYVSDEEIVKIVKNYDPENACKKLTQLAKIGRAHV